MSLKIRFPDKIHLLRGNHEDKWINNAFGFADECSNRLGEDPTDHDSVYNKINDFFDWLPLCAVIEDRIVCLHGGIGSTLVSLEQID
jgi:protein phosphatase